MVSLVATSSFTSSYSPINLYRWGGESVTRREGKRQPSRWLWSVPVGQVPSSYLFLYTYIHTGISASMLTIGLSSLYRYDNVLSILCICLCLLGFCTTSFQPANLFLLCVTPTRYPFRCCFDLLLLKQSYRLNKAVFGGRSVCYSWLLFIHSVFSTPSCSVSLGTDSASRDSFTCCSPLFVPSVYVIAITLRIYFSGFVL